MKLFFDLRNPAIWLWASLAVAIVATNATWLLLRFFRKDNSKPDGPIWSILPALGWLLVSLFMLLPPPAAWRQGALSPRLMGLTGNDWIENLRTGAPLMLFTIGVLIFGWLIYRRSLPGDRTRSRSERLGAVLRAPVDAALLQWHWAFYRALTIALLPLAAGLMTSSAILRPIQAQLIDASLYWGSWLGMTLVALEWLLNPFARADLRRPSRQGSREIALLRLALAVATTALFVLTSNFWLPLICSVVVETAIAGWFSLPK